MTTKTNNPRPARSLSATLIMAFLILSVVILLASGGLQLFFYIQAQQQAVSNQQVLIAQGAAKTVSSFIEEKFTVLSTTATWLANPTVTSSDARTEILNSLLASQSEFRQFAFFDKDNAETTLVTRMQINSAAASAIFVSHVTRNILAQAQLGQNYISPVYFDPDNSEPLVLMAIPVVNALGNYQGTLVAELNLISMWNSVNQLKVGNTGYVYVVNNQGMLIAFKDTDRALKGENVANIQLVHEFVINSSSAPAMGTSIYTGINGESVVGAYAPLGTPDWAVVAELPSQEAYQPVSQVIAVSIGIILMMAVLASLVGILIARRLATPLVDLTKTATRIADGEMELQAMPGGAQEIVTLATAFNSMTAQLRELINSLEQRVKERTSALEEVSRNADRRAAQFEAIALIVKAINSVHRMDALLPQIATVISERFGYYHVGIFLNDENNQTAILSASNSEGGQRMLKRGHRLKIGEQGIVGYVAAAGTVRVARSVGEDAVYFNNPDLPETLSEMALPLRVENQIVGVLDVQSKQTDAFSSEDIGILSLLADEVSLAIDNTRLFETTNKSLAEAEALYRQYLRQAWNRLPREERLLGYRYSISGSSPLESPIDLDADSIGGNKKEEETNRLIVPIKLRNELIGNLVIQVPQGKEWNQDQLDLAQAVADRVALSAENARLFNETSRRAERERMVTEITSKIRSTNNPAEMINIALNELRSALGATQVQLIPQVATASKDGQLKVETASNGNGAKK